jgi:hypothetical protein
MAVTYENVFYDFCLDPLRDLIVTEYNYGKVYISPEILHKDPFSIKIWGASSETEQYFASAWQQQYNVLISLYEIEKNPGETFFKQFINDAERLYQLLYTNAKTKSTTLSSGSGSNTSSVTHTWIDGVCEGFTINELEGEEEEIEGLNVAKFEFSCKIMRIS